ncbi:core histone macro- isoform X2 [Brachionus plicatilis]|uniref:Histone H2A n=1 Tax=Brachionus plicatilis TaxID=10195 RepID=A0A3M7SUB0_BRAPC|nr:core histone macro- isoform X2 [Brachionus plicatilis]
MGPRGYPRKRRRTSKSIKAGITFPVTRFHRKLKSLPQMPHRIYQNASVYLSATIEYLIAEILELGGNAARDNSRARISPRHLMLAIKTDSELEQLFKKCILPGSGVIPSISSALIQNKAASSLGKVTPKTKPMDPKAKNVSTKKGIAKKIYMFDDKDETNETSKNVTLLNERTLATGQKLKVIQADITNVVADAIVHPTNNSFYMGGEVGSAIARAGGQEVRNLVDELHKTYGNLGVGSAAMSQASKNMLCKNIIHVYSPSWDTMQQVQRIDELTKVVQNILTLAETNKLQSVALPSISSGANGFPKQVAAQTILRAINEHFKSIESNKTKSTVDQVIFVLYDTESVNIYTSELGKLSI